MADGCAESREIRRGVDLQRGRLLGGRGLRLGIRLGLRIAVLLAPSVLNAQIPNLTITTPVLSQPIFPGHMAADASGNVWFTDIHVFPHSVGFFNAASGAATKYPILLPDGASLQSGTTINLFQGLAIGPDGNTWFVFVYAMPDGSPLTSYVGRVTPAGAAAIFPLPSVDACFNVDCPIAKGPDGNLWIAEPPKGKILRVTPAGVMTEFSPPNAFGYPSGITGGPDGNVWFTEFSGQKVGRITPAGAITEFPIGGSGAGPLGIVTGPDGNLWFCEYGFAPGGNKIGRITPGGVITEYPITVPNAQAWNPAFGPDGNLYFTCYGTSQLGEVPISGSPFAFTAIDIKPVDIVLPAGSSPTNYPLYLSGFKPVGSGQFEDALRVATFALKACNPPLSIVQRPGSADETVEVGSYVRFFFELRDATSPVTVSQVGNFPYETATTFFDPSPTTPAGSAAFDVFGTAGSTGDFTTTLTVTDARGCSATVVLHLRVTPPRSGTSDREPHVVKR